MANGHRVVSALKCSISLTAKRKEKNEEFWSCSMGIDEWLLDLPCLSPFELPVTPLSI